MKRALLALIIAGGVFAMSGCGSGDIADASQGDGTSKNHDGNGGDQEGSRDKPYAPSDVVHLENWDVSLAKTDTDATKDLESDGFNEIKAGSVAIQVRVSVTYTGKKSDDPGMDVVLEFVSSKGNTFDDSSGDGCLPEKSLQDIGNMYPKAKGEGDECVQMPKDAVKGGVWKISSLLGDKTAFVAMA
ncbi:MAG TPA: hypothetical protein VE172_01065 [Stackebrandtia sp.]|uniref:hypothetical protein n=1 Tax=Stackebrandtia sp. TaxID=2023065 RepID=UPI002D719C34|nr:hypothetical protein [Stackebrandtia sp.]HZE37380.1 hypothetical protein [Stackebrandtia sp.]